MTQQEFKDRTGLDLQPKNFEYIHRVYMAAGEMDKDDFCRDFNNCGGIGSSEIVAQLTHHVERLAKMLKESQEMEEDFIDFLVCEADAMSSTHAQKKAIEMVGHAELIRRKIERGFSLWKQDLEYIAENLK